MRIYACALLLIAGSLSGVAQTAPPFISSYANQILTELEETSPVSVEDWTRQHTGDSLETRFDAGSEQSLYELEGRWCVRSTANIDLEGGVTVRRIALFYPPLVENLTNIDLPPLPSEKGQTLIRNGCHLHKVLYEIQGIGSARIAGEAIASQMKQLMYEVSGPDGINFPPNLTPLHSYIHSGPSFDFAVAVGNSGRPDNQPYVLLIWQPLDLEHSESSLGIDPLAGQPWLAVRAARLAALPLAPTLAMLSLLAPRTGDPGEQPRLHCSTDLVPALRKWMAIARSASPPQHAAALVLANEVATRLRECDEYTSGIPYRPPSPGDAEWKAYDSLTRSLAELGISMIDTREGPQYAGNLLDKATVLAAKGPVNELERIAAIDSPCTWAKSSEWPDREISLGESILSDFAPDEWTASVHLILAEAYIHSMDNAASDGGTVPRPGTDSREKAIEHYRKYYALSTNPRDRALVWQEIWNLQAGLEPRFRLPFCLGMW